MKRPRTCVRPGGKFQYGVHKPTYSVVNLRHDTHIEVLGRTTGDTLIDNSRNYPAGDIKVEGADWIFEIPNPFPFKGCTYIDKEWADACAAQPERIRIATPPEVSFASTLRKKNIDRDLYRHLPDPVLLALATCSTDPEDLVILAGMSCEITLENGRPTGLRFQKDGLGRLRPVIHNHALFEAVANNPCLPDLYKILMVLRPGAQGPSEIVGEWPSDGNTHVYEYLRRNSYIPGGHYAANMADDAIRYSVTALSPDDIRGLRHLYYQRSYVRLATELAIPFPYTNKMLTAEELEALRLAITSKIGDQVPSAATLWGWNFGFDFAPSAYRLHASHQQIHQQYAMIPARVTSYIEGCVQDVGHQPSYSCGDLVADLIDDYTLHYRTDFFTDYRKALAGNVRMDGRTDLPSDLVVWCDDNCMLFVPKAQTSQWELQLMTLPDRNGSLAGNILECDQAVRHSLDAGILKAQKALAGLGAKMVTSIEYSKRFTAKIDHRQPLLYAFLPRLPESPGAFSEAQLRFINGHYPEDFAAVCRNQLE